LREQKSFSKSGKLLCLMLAVVLMLGTFVSAGTDEPAIETAVETPTPSVEPDTPEPAPAPQGEPETAPTPSAEPTVSPEPKNTTYANSISGVLWIDANEDGTYDNGEQALADYPVYLYVEGDTDNVVQTATTDADGEYIFEDIQPGRYVVGIKAEENGTEYLLPLCGVQNDNKFYFTPDWSQVVSSPIDVEADSVITDIFAGMRTPPQAQPMANTTYTIDITSQATVTSSITAQSIPGVSIASNVLTFNTAVDPTDTYILTGTTTTVRVVVATGVSADITLSDISITNSAVSPFQLVGTANVNLTLEASTTNVLKCSSTVTTAGAIRAGLYVPIGTKVTIGGTGTLEATGARYGAGIGGSPTTTTVTSSNSHGTIIINSGTIIATGGAFGAGIGNGCYTVASSGGIITINGGTITATGNNATGIGGAYNADGGTINITGGTITATSTGTSSAAGIGLGQQGLNATINISGGIVIATGINSAAGIGTASPITGTGAAITISGGSVTAISGSTNSPGIGTFSKTGTVNLGTVVFTGGSIYPTDSAGTVSVYPNPTNGTYGYDPVGMLTFTQFAGQDFSIMTAGSAGIAYAYKGTGHTAAAYPWLTYPGVTTDTVTAMSTTAASVTAPSTVNSAASSTAILNGTYYLNNTYPVTSAYFEWGTSTSYGTTIDMTSSVNTSEITTAARSLSSPALTGLTPGVTYHYRLVIVTNSITVRGNDVTFTTPALAPSVDATHDYQGGTTATLYGIYDLNGGTFVSGEFELSTDSGGTWSTPAGGTLTGSITTPTLNLTGLMPGATYHYRLTVTNSAGAATTIVKELTVSAKNLTISKTVTGAYANMEKASTFTVTLLESDGVTPLNGTFNYTGGIIAGSGATAPANGTLTLNSSGAATFTLQHGQTITIAGIATSGKVRIVETADSNYATSFKDSEDASSTSSADTGVRAMTAADRTFDFTNARSVVPGGVSTGSGGIVLLALPALLALAAGFTIAVVHRRRARA